MSETITEREAVEEPVVESAAEAVSDEQLIGMLVDRARTDGLQLTGEGRLLQQLTKRVLESALEGEITDHVGYEKHDATGRNKVFHDGPYRTVSDVEYATASWVEWYNNRRLHSSLGMISPTEYEAAHYADTEPRAD